MRSHDLVWAVALLECVPSVEVLSIGVRRGRLYDVDGTNGRDVDTIDVDVHAESWSEALRLVQALGLREDTDAARVTESSNGGSMGFRTWRGWAAEGSHELPVCVEVTAAEVVPASWLVGEPVAS